MAISVQSSLESLVLILISHCARQRRALRTRRVNSGRSDNAKAFSPLEVRSLPRLMTQFSATEKGGTRTVRTCRVLGGDENVSTIVSIEVDVGVLASDAEAK